MGADDELGDAKVDDSRDAAEDHDTAKSETIVDPTNDDPQGRTESMKSGVEDTDKAGAEETAEATRAESVGDGDAAAEVPGEHKAKPPKDD